MNTNSAAEIVTRLCNDLPTVNQDHVINLVSKFGLYDAARIMGYDVSHYNNLLISGRLAIEHLKKSSPKNILEYAEIMKERLNTDTYHFICVNHEALQKAIVDNDYRDYDHDWFSANTMITMYSANPIYGKPGVETPQYTWMRIAIQMYFDTPNAVKDVIRAYEEMSIGWYTPASPTIFNAGMKQQQMSSCFLLTVGDDLFTILKTLLRGGMISKSSGGLGMDVSRVRHSEIGQTGWSNGIIPMLQLYNSMVRYVDQGGRRKGAATIFLRPHHIDVEDFIELSRKVGDKNARAHDINTCLWTSWIFWDRVQKGGKWTLFCPARVPQLNDIYGEDYTKAYIAAENDPNISHNHKKVIDARKLYDKILNIQRESGMPYLMNGDACNIKSNHRNLGYIRSSNLCLEIVEHTDDETIAVCNLHSLSLRMFARGPIVKTGDIAQNLRAQVDFNNLAHISRRVVENLNKVIEHNWYPLDKMKDGVLTPKIINKSNKRDRPVGMGVSGFAEMLHILDIAFEDNETKVLNKMVFGCMYWNALAKSIQLSINEGTYDSFEGSPTSEGKLQFDLWKEEFDLLGYNNARSVEDDEPIDPAIWGQEPFFLTRDNNIVCDIVKPTWDDLKRCIVKYGVRNSLLIALMPTASTAQVRRNCESVEAHQNNMYSRKVLKCSYPVLNRYLVSDLEALHVWNDSIVEFIRVKNGSINGLGAYIENNRNLFPNYNDTTGRMKVIERKYKTMWEIPQKVLMRLAADRGRYIDQSASTNVYIKDCTDDKLRACHLYANMLGLKTLMYYLRQTGGETIKFTAEPGMIQHIKGLVIEEVKEEKVVEKVVEKELVAPSSVAPSNDKPKIICTDEICVSCT